jgi:hypothetical protein
MAGVSAMAGVPSTAGAPVVADVPAIAYVTAVAVFPVGSCVTTVAPVPKVTAYRQASVLLPNFSEYLWTANIDASFLLCNCKYEKTYHNNWVFSCPQQTKDLS